MSQQQLAPEVPLFTRKTVPLQAHNLELPLTIGERLIIWVGTIFCAIGVATTISWAAELIANYVVGA